MQEEDMLQCLKKIKDCLWDIDFSDYSKRGYNQKLIYKAFQRIEEAENKIRSDINK